jgi:hypothetical protein
MSEAEEVVEEIVIEDVEIIEELSDLSPAEEKATASGWRPQEEWSGEEDDWIDAKTFNRNGEFMSRIQHQTKQMATQAAELETLKAGMKSLGEHNKKIAEQEYKNAIASLKKERVSAREDDDHVAVDEINDKIDDLKETKREMDSSTSEEMHEAAQEVAPNPAFVEWSSKNDWYQKDVLLRGAADAVGMEYADANPGAPIEDVLKFVSKKMMKEFPQKFGNTRQSSPSSVTEPTGATRRTKKSKHTPKDLNDEQKQFAKMFVETGAFENEQEYVDSLVKSGDL